MDFLFVYGTLRQGHQHPMAKILEYEGSFFGQGQVKGKLYDLGEYPGVVLGDEGGNRVFGDVYVLPSNTSLLKIMDEYEGVSSLHSQQDDYRRVLTDIYMPEGNTIRAWVYEYIGPISPEMRIALGDYLVYLNSRL